MKGRNTIMAGAIGPLRIPTERTVTIVDTTPGFDVTTLFDTVYTPLHRYCLGLTGDADSAHDAAQEAFVRLVQKDVQGNPTALKVWLFKVATHVIRDRYRVDSNRERLLAENPPFVDRVEGTGDRVERAEVIRDVRRTLSELPERDQQLLLMKHQGFSYREMAAALDIAATSIGTLLARAQRRFASLHDRKEES